MFKFDESNFLLVSMLLELSWVSKNIYQNKHHYKKTNIIQRALSVSSRLRNSFGYFDPKTCKHVYRLTWGENDKLYHTSKGVTT